MCPSSSSSWNCACASAGGGGGCVSAVVLQRVRLARCVVFGQLRFLQSLWVVYVVDMLPGVCVVC